MPTHHFTLIVDGADLQDEPVVNGLFESGCGDALTGSADGVQFIDFDRDATSLGDAVLSAVAEAERVDGWMQANKPVFGRWRISSGQFAQSRTQEKLREAQIHPPSHLWSGLDHSQLPHCLQAHSPKFRKGCPSKSTTAWACSRGIRQARVFCADRVLAGLTPVSPPAG